MSSRTTASRRRAPDRSGRTRSRPQAPRGLRSGGLPTDGLPRRTPRPRARTAGLTGSGATGAAAGAVARRTVTGSRRARGRLGDERPELVHSPDSPCSSSSISSIRIRTSFGAPSLLLSGRFRVRGRSSTARSHRALRRGGAGCRCAAACRRSRGGRWHSATLRKLRELDLGEPERESPLRHLRGDRGEQPAVVGVGQAAPDPVDRLGRRALLGLLLGSSDDLILEIYHV